MTIKEMEARTGLTRANIRFYEAEGLITPERRPNGYRDYSEEDLAVLEPVLNDLSDFMPQTNTTLYGVHITCVTDWPPEGDYAKIEFSMDKAE